MIHHVWVINKAGICLLDRNYSGFEVNKQLFSGFITALSYFAAQFNRRLDSIGMGDTTIHYLIEDNVITAVAVDKDDNEEEIRRKLGELQADFKLKYGDLLKCWDGDLNCFNPFIKDLDRILMLDWNFDYDIQIKSKKVKPSAPKKKPLELSQRGLDLFEAIRTKSKMENE